jgi:DNA (cytosine-5)-methyltransferase 1
LDLYSGAGGAAVGLHRAGFEVTGCDNRPQPRYPFRFILGDALEVDLEGYDCYWASPPCQFATMAGQQWRKSGKQYPDLIAPTRERLLATGKPYIIENVPRAPLINPVVLNGAFFGLNLRRTRLFECSFPVPAILLPGEAKSSFRMGRPVRDGSIITPVGHFSGVAYAQRVMGIDWMGQKDLAQAIPPAFSEYLGQYLMKAVGV